MANLQCQIQFPQEAKSGLTVGMKFFLNCQGEVPQLDRTSLELRLDEQDKYKLKILDFSQQGGQLQLVVTSYRTGDHSLKALQLVDKTHSLVLGDVQFQVQSVIDPKAAMEAKVEPFGPMGPLPLTLPWWVYASLAIAVTLLLVSVVQFFRKRSQRKKLVAELDQFGTALTPYHQFTKSIRQIVREHPSLAHPNSMVAGEEQSAILTQLNQSFRLYMGRTFAIPTLHWSDQEILKELRKANSKVYKRTGVQFKKAFEELRHAKKFSAQLPAKDLIQIMELIRHNVDETQKLVSHEPS